MKESCQFCKGSRYSFCKSHVPEEQLRKIGFIVRNGWSQYDDTSKLFTLKDFFYLFSKRKAPFIIKRDKEGNAWKGYLHHWVPYFNSQNPIASKDTDIECVGNKECFLFLNRGYYCKKHQI